MNSIKDIYRIGHGPSSSHTIAPSRAVSFFKETYPDIDKTIVNLHGSLALTGKGHFTDKIIIDSFKPIPCEVFFNYDKLGSIMTIEAYKGEQLIDKWTCKSLGGGSLYIDKFDTKDDHEFYEHNSFDTIKAYLKERNINLLDYIYERDPELKEYLNEIIDQMIMTINEGLTKEGVLTTKIRNVEAVAKNLNKQAKEENDDDLLLISYAYSAMEENARGGVVVTAPTLGSCGIIAALVYHLIIDKKVAKERIIDCLAVAGLFGNLIKKNASISGAIGGCQAEIGSATAMAAAFYAKYLDLKLETIEYAAEVGVEHSLGLTCDPVKGYVIIPCIERNGVGIIKALNAVKIAKNVHLFKNNTVSFDEVVKTMDYIGKHMVYELKETSLGGLSKFVCCDDNA